MVAFSSHHFPISAVINVQIEAGRKRPTKTYRNWKSLQSQEVRERLLADIRLEQNTNGSNLDDRWEALRISMDAAVERHMPEQARKQHKLWIRRTLWLIEERTIARQNDDRALERSLSKEIKRSARSDRACWLDELAATGYWQALRKLRKKPQMKQSRLRDLDGNIVSSEARASAMGDYLERVQWRE